MVFDIDIDKALNKHKRNNCLHSWKTSVHFVKKTFHIEDYKECVKCGKKDFSD